MKDRELENSLFRQLSCKYEISSKYRFQKWRNTEVQIPKLAEEKGRKTGYELVEQQTPLSRKGLNLGGQPQ